VIAGPQPRAASRRPDTLVLAPILFAALLLRLTGLGARSLWTDEGSTWTAASSPLRELIRLCAQKDASPPLFYLLTSLALKIGDTEAWLRSVSVVASLGMVWLTYRIARLAASRSEASLAAVLVALSPHQLMFAQEARTYMTVACFTTWALYLFARAALLDRRRAWLPFVLVSALGLWTQSIALLGVGVQATLIVLTPAGRRNAWRWLLAQAAAFALYAPWIAINLAQASHLSHSHWYLRTPGGHEVFQVLRAVFLSPIPLVTPPPGATLPGLEAFLPRPVAHLILTALPIVPLLFGAREALRPGPAGQVQRFALAGLCLPLLAVWLVSFKVPLWLPRYFVFLTPMLAVLTARGLWAMRPPGLSYAWTALLLLASGYACFRYSTDYAKEPWRQVVHFIGMNQQPGHAAVLVPFDVDPFRYYDRRLDPPLAAIEVSHPDVPFASDYTPRQLDEMETAARARAASYDQVWVIVRSPNSEVRREVARRAERAAESDGRVLKDRSIWTSMSGPLRVARFERPAPGDSGAAAKTAH